MKVLSRCSYKHLVYEIVHDINDFEKTEYLQLCESGPVKPKPVIFILKSIPDGEVSVSMHYEGLSFKVFSWFISYVNAYWGLTLPENSLLKKQE